MKGKGVEKIYVFYVRFIHTILYSYSIIISYEYLRKGKIPFSQEILQGFSVEVDKNVNKWIKLIIILCTNTYDNVTPFLTGIKSSSGPFSVSNITEIYSELGTCKKFNQILNDIYYLLCGKLCKTTNLWHMNFLCFDDFLRVGKMFVIDQRTFVIYQRY